MTILYYCDEYPPFRNGGIGTVVKLVAEQLVARGHTVIIAGKYVEGGKHNKTVSHELINGVKIYRYHQGAYTTLPRKLLGILQFIVVKLENSKLYGKINNLKTKRDYRKTESLLAKLIAKYDVDLIEFPDYVDEFLHGLTHPIKFRNFNIPLIIRVHGSVTFLDYFRQGRVNPDLQALDLAHFNRADKICAVSKFSKEFVMDKIIPKRSVDVIYNPVEDELFQLPAKRETENTILFFGKIVETKGTFTLIKAFNQVAITHPQVRLKLIGTGDLEVARSLVDERIKDRVIFQGFLPKSEIIKEIDKSLFCVLPSYFENFSMAALEVLARKKALIYTERASGAELIEDGVNGWLVDPENIEQIVEKIEFAIDKKHCTESIAKNGQVSCLERFSAELIMPQLEKYYLKIINTTLLNKKKI